MGIPFRITHRQVSGVRSTIPIPKLCLSRRTWIGGNESTGVEIRVCSGGKETAATATTTTTA